MVIPLPVRMNCLKRAHGVCEHCSKALTARVMRSDIFPCWKCGQKTNVEIGSETAEDSLKSAWVDDSWSLQTSYVMQHCSHCQAKIGNFYVEERLLDYPEEFYGTEFIYHLHHIAFNTKDNWEENLLVVHPECHREIHAQHRESSI